MTDEKNNLSSLITGIIIGASITYLFGTKSGQKLKDKLLKEGSLLLEKMGEGLEETQDKLEDTKETISEIPQKFTEETQNVQQNVTAGVESIKENIEEAASEIPKHIEQIQKKGRRFFFHRKHNSES